MLSIRVENLNDLAIIECKGRIVRSDSVFKLRDAVREQAEARIIALDPVTGRQLWDYDYTWEVYTPPARRVRGYYALPILAGVKFVGHVDPKADRAKKKLVIVNRSLRRGHRVAPAVRELACFLGLAKMPPS